MRKPMLAKMPLAVLVAVSRKCSQARVELPDNARQVRACECAREAEEDDDTEEAQESSRVALAR